MTVSAAIPVTGVALCGAAFSDRELACSELCVLAHPAKLSTNVASTRNPNFARYLIIFITTRESLLARFRL
jgi:hypothetical protein